MDVNATLIIPLVLMVIALAIGGIWFYTKNEKVERILRKILDFLQDLRF